MNPRSSWVLAFVIFIERNNKLVLAYIYSNVAIRTVWLWNLSIHTYLRAKNFSHWNNSQNTGITASRVYIIKTYCIGFPFAMLLRVCNFVASRYTAHGENFMAIFTTLSVVIWFFTGTLGIFATLVYVFTMGLVIYDILGMAIIPTLSTSILFWNLCYILLWILPRSVVKIVIRI